MPAPSRARAGSCRAAHLANYRFEFGCRLLGIDRGRRGGEGIDGKMCWQGLTQHEPNLGTAQLGMTRQGLSNLSCRVVLVRGLRRRSRQDTIAIQSCWAGPTSRSARPARRPIEHGFRVDRRADRWPSPASAAPTPTLLVGSRVGRRPLLRPYQPSPSARTPAVGLHCGVHAIVPAPCAAAAGFHHT